MFNARRNPVLSAASIDSLFQNAAAATSGLSGPDAHGYHGFDWAAIDNAANHVYRASKGGWLPGQGSVVTFTTGGFGFVIALNGNKRAGVKTDWFDPVSKAATAHSWPSKDLFPEFGMPSLTAVRIQIALTRTMVAKASPAKAERQVEASFARTRLAPPRVVRRR
jgi:hypothetical protein